MTGLYRSRWTTDKPPTCGRQGGPAVAHRKWRVLIWYAARPAESLLRRCAMETFLPDGFCRVILANVAGKEQLAEGQRQGGGRMSAGVNRLVVPGAGCAVCYRTV